MHARPIVMTYILSAGVASAQKNSGPLFSSHSIVELFASAIEMIHTIAVGVVSAEKNSALSQHTRWEGTVARANR